MDIRQQYIDQHFVHEDQILKQVRDNIPKAGLPSIHIKPAEGLFLQMLVTMSKAVRVLEIGTLGGYSGIWLARGLPDNGSLVTIEKEPHHAEVAESHFALAGLSNKVEIRIGNAHQVLEQLEKEPPFDFVFIDAEKTGYIEYFNWAVKNIKTRGVITAHNAFRHDRIFNLEGEDENTNAIAEFNLHVANEERVISTIFPSGDGILTAIKL